MADKYTLSELLNTASELDDHYAEGTPVRIRLHNGELVEIKDFEFSYVNGGELHIIAGPTQEEEDEEIDKQLDMMEDSKDEV